LVKQTVPLVAELLIEWFDMLVPNVQVEPNAVTDSEPAVPLALTTIVPEPPLVVLVEPPPLVVVVLVEPPPLVVVVLVEPPPPQFKLALPEPIQSVYQLLLLTDIL
jgi:hypothetical protein